MILSVSRRTDIPSFYSEWFMNRLREGFVYVRNPFNSNQISKIELNPSHSRLRVKNEEKMVLTTTVPGL